MVLDARRDPPVPLFTVHRVHREGAEQAALLILGMMAAQSLGVDGAQKIAKLGGQEGMDAAGLELLKAAPRLLLAALETKCGCQGGDALEAVFSKVGSDLPWPKGGA